MTREQQRQLKALKIALPKMLKEIAKEKKLKKKDDMLYDKKGDLFFDCFLFVSVNSANECICSTEERFKPMWLDDLFWELFDMKENSKEPVSLRATGAFAVSGASIYKDETILSEWTEEALRGVVEKYVDHFCESMKNTDYALFEETIHEGYHHELRAALYYLHTGQYQKALDEVGDQRGYFHNGGLDINDAIRAYANAYK